MTLAEAGLSLGVVSVVGLPHLVFAFGLFAAFALAALAVAGLVFLVHILIGAIHES